MSASTASHPMNPAGSTTTDTSPAAAKNNGTSDTTSATKVKPIPEKENPFVSLVSSEEQVALFFNYQNIGPLYANCTMKATGLIRYQFLYSNQLN